MRLLLEVVDVFVHPQERALQLTLCASGPRPAPQACRVAACLQSLQRPPRRRCAGCGGPSCRGPGARRRPEVSWRVLAAWACQMEGRRG